MHNIFITILLFLYLYFAVMMVQVVAEPHQTIYPVAVQSVAWQVAWYSSAEAGAASVYV